jgi:hypothetical protein
MSREAKIRATSAALQPKSLDLAALRQRSLRESQMRVRQDDAAGALGFAEARGDPLPGVLLRLKYAHQRTEEGYKRAQALLLHRHGGLARKPSLIMGAVAMAALLEWVHDECQRCRNRRQGVIQPRPCGDCKNGYFETIETRKGPRQRLVTSPRPGCVKCHGSGRVFDDAERSRGIRCVACSNSGRVTFVAKKRYRIVSELVGAAQRALDRPITGITWKTFSSTWHAKYARLVDILRTMDRHQVGENLDFGYVATENSPIEPSPQEQDQLGEDEPAGCPTVDEPATPKGPVPP